MNNYTQSSGITSDTRNQQRGNKVFSKELSKVNHHNTVSNAAINILEDAFKKIKEKTEYKEKVLKLIKRGLGSSLKEYRADAWPVGYESEFDARSQNSFYKKTSKSKKEKELMEE